METKIPTSEGDKTTTQIIDSLYYASYKANRDEGVTHESLVNIGVGNDAMKMAYESEGNQLVNLPCGWKCKKEEQERALKVYYDAYDKYFDGFNYDKANAMADRALYAHMTQ